MIGAATMLAAALLGAATPPPVPPDPNAVEAAGRLLERHPPDDAALDAALAKAIEIIANGTVSSAYRGEWGGARWRTFRMRFVAAASAMIAPHRSALVQEARECVASTWAQSGSATHFDEIGQGVAAGTIDWAASAPGQSVWEHCFYTPARQRIDFDAALVASGLPRRSEPPLNR